MRKYYRLRDFLPIYEERDCFNVYLTRYKIETNFIMIKEASIRQKTRLATLDEWNRIIQEMYKKSKPHSRTIRRLLVTMYSNLEEIKKKQEELDSKNS